MEFFGDTVDSIREFDLDDQRSRGPVQHIDILPMQDVLVSREMIRAMGGEERASHWQDDVVSKRPRARNAFSQKAENSFPALTFLLPLAFPLESTIFDYAEGAVLVLDEPEVLTKPTRSFWKPSNSVTNKPSRPEAWPCLRRVFSGRPKNWAAHGFRIRGCILKSWAPRSFRMPCLSRCVRIRARAGTEESRNWPKRFAAASPTGTQVVLLGSTLGMAERLRDFLHEYDIPFRLEFGEQPLKVVDDPLGAACRNRQDFRRTEPAGCRTC